MGRGRQALAEVEQDRGGDAPDPLRLVTVLEHVARPSAEMQGDSFQLVWIEQQVQRHFEDLGDLGGIGARHEAGFDQHKRRLHAEAGNC